ncbi:MAG: sulfatase-like hydrolase/transferase, partial [Bryobacteraceae bacterium]
DAFTDHAISQVRRMAASPRPFFLHVAYNAPHYPMQARAEDIAKQKGRYDAGYLDVRRRRYERLKEMGIVPPGSRLPELDTRIGKTRYDLEVPDWNKIPDRARQIQLMEVYAAMVSRLDHGVGRLLASLREAGVEKNTLVLFLSDNGGCASMPLPSEMAQYNDYNLGTTPGSKQSYELCGPGWAAAQSAPFRRYKTWTYEGGISTPMIARWPGTVPENRVSHEPGHLVDIFPALRDLAGGAKNLTGDGTSLVGRLRGEAGPARREMWWYLYGSRAYRQGRWKVVFGVTRREWELYDIESDRTETQNLAAKHPEVLKQLTGKWFAIAKRSEVDWETDQKGDRL